MPALICAEFPAPNEGGSRGNHFCPVDVFPSSLNPLCCISPGQAAGLKPCFVSRGARNQLPGCPHAQRAPGQEELPQIPSSVALGTWRELGEIQLDQQLTLLLLLWLWNSQCCPHGIHPAQELCPHCHSSPCSLAVAPEWCFWDDRIWDDTALEMELSSHVLRFPDQVFTVLHKYPDLSLKKFFWSVFPVGRGMAVQALPAAPFWSCWCPELCGFVPGVLALASVTRVSIRDQLICSAGKLRLECQCLFYPGF